MPSNAKIHFELQQDSDGHPPVGVESVWAHSGIEENQYVIDNTPFFAYEATLGDIVKVTASDDGLLWFAALVEASTNSLVRVVFFDRGATEDVTEALLRSGCIVERMLEYNIIAASIPASISLEAVRAYLDAAAADGIIDYEEAIMRQ
jgi:hypothetical protein